MANTESTAVNELIELVMKHAAARPDAPSDDDELMFRPPVALPRSRAARGTSRLPPIPPPPARLAQGTPMPEIVARRPRPTLPPPTRPRLSVGDDELLGATIPFQRTAQRAGTATRLIAPVAALAIAAACVGGYLAFSGEHRRAPVAVAPVPAAPPIHAVAPPPPRVTPVTVPVAAPAAPRAPLVEIPLDSMPAGASVILVDNGHPAYLGTTPVRVSVDPSHSYDVVFAAEGHPPRLEHLDPARTHHLVAALDTRVATQPIVRPRPRIAIGHLMVSSKPPCEIVIDGKPTHLTTPQPSLALAAGRHAVTLINAERHLQRSVVIQVAAGTDTRLVQNLMK